jgi:hypothetical protein
MAKPSVFATVGFAFSDTVRAARAMPVLVLVAVIVSGAHALADWMFGLSLSDTALTGKVLLIKLVLGVAYAILLAPVLIAIFRFIILGEVARGYTLDLNNPRFQLFCAWSIALFLLTEGLGLVPRVLGAESDIGAALDWLLVVAYFAIAVGLTLLFAAIAVDAPGATLRNTLSDLRGSFWRASAILLLILLPILVVFLIGMIGLTEIAKIENTDAVLWFATLAWELLWTAAAARLFVALADRLRSPASR